MNPEQIGFIIGAVGGSIVAGALCGLLPFFVARAKRRKKLAVGSLITCIAVSLLAGIMLTLPVAVIFTIIAALLKKQ